MIYRTRKAQLDAMAKEVKAGKTTVRAALRHAAMIGAVEERGRTLLLIRAGPTSLPMAELERAIVGESVLKVLGYEK